MLTHHTRTYIQATRTPATQVRRQKLYERGRRCMRCGAFLSRANHGVLCWPCQEMLPREYSSGDDEHMSIDEARVLFCLRQEPCSPVPLSSVLCDLSYNRIMHILACLERRGYVFRRSRGHGCALIAEPLR